MNAQKVILGLVVGVGTALAVKKLMEGTKATGSSGDGHLSQTVHVVEEVLHKHAGEDTPFVHAFEEALEHEMQDETQLAHDAGLRGA